MSLLHHLLWLFLLASFRQILHILFLFKKKLAFYYALAPLHIHRNQKSGSFSSSSNIPLLHSKICVLNMERNALHSIIFSYHLWFFMNLILKISLIHLVRVFQMVYFYDFLIRSYVLSELNHDDKIVNVSYSIYFDWNYQIIETVKFLFSCHKMMR